MTAEPIAYPTPTATKDMKDIVALCKRRGFVYPASDIYGGINGFWDYGPLGIELKNNLRDLWWKRMVNCPPLGPDGTPIQIVGLDSAIIQNPAVWVASGHVGGFADPMVDCRETKKRYRADHVKVIKPLKYPDLPMICFLEGSEIENIQKQVKKVFKDQVNNLRSSDIDDYFDPIMSSELNLTNIDYSDYSNLIGPDTTKKGTLTEPKQFNLLFETHTGAVQSSDNIAYLRGETAQGIFINFKNVVDSMRVKMPFGIAQIGKAFRNEVNPRNFIFRSREFEQMEMEFFCHPDTAQDWFNFWKTERVKFWRDIGLSDENLLLREHDADELVFYSKGTFDIEYKFPFTAPGFGELEGIAYRTDYDLTQHQEHSKQKLEYMDPVTNEKYIPHVIEPAAGLTRGMLALLCEAYTIDPNRPSGMFLNFHPKVAPIKAAILPLMAKDGHPELAQKIYMDLREDYMVELDIKQNIGKRYARQDEIGTPFCFTVDGQSLTDNTVTVRTRNTMAQERISIDSIRAFLAEKIK